MRAADIPKIAKQEHLVFLVAGAKYFLYPSVFRIGPKDIPYIREGERKLYIFGYVDYVDNFGSHHRGGYAREFSYPVYLSAAATHVELDNLLPVTLDGYSYDRERKKGEGDDW